mgnify:CR=1 FL=1
MSWGLAYTNQAQKDALKASKAGLRPKIEGLLAVLAKNPFQNPPPYKSLVGDLAGAAHDLVEPALRRPQARQDPRAELDRSA